MTIVERLRAAGCVFAEEEAALLTAEASTSAALEGMLVRRIAGEPLEQVVGWAEFRGIRLAVEPGVFVPRRRTGLLVEQALPLVSSPVVDLCCGIGAIGAALLAEAGPFELYAADLDPVAVRCARRNLPDAVVVRGDLYDALPGELRGRVGLLVANVPYVPTGAIGSMPPEARDHEHRIALDGGPDGLDLVRRYLSGAADWLVPGGSVLVEIGVAQVPAAVSAAAGLSVRVAEDDGTAVLIGTR